jgi:2,3-dihydroxybenzoate decarboxylase
MEITQRTGVYDVRGKIALEEHYESHDFNAAGVHNFTNPEYFEGVQERLVNIDLRIGDMDRNGIEIYIMSLTQPGIEGIPDAAKAIEMAKRMNDYAATKLVAKYPDRLRAFACVPLQNPEKAAAELERTVKELGFVGALINGYSNIGDENTAQYLDEPQVDVFWKKVEELDVPVYLHPRIPLPNQQRIYKGYDGLLGSAWGFGIETATHVVRMMLSGLFDRRPKLKLIVGHLGEAMPFTLPRLDHRLRHQRTETQGPHKKKTVEYLQSNIYVTTSGVFRTQTLLSTLLEIGSDRVLLSVDSPYKDANELTPWFDTCPISEVDRQKIGRTNSKALFKL